MSYEKEFKEFLNKDGNGYLRFLECFATMDGREVIQWNGILYCKIRERSPLALIYAREYEKANYAKYMHSLDFDMEGFSYVDCIEADINGLFTELDERTHSRLIRDYERLRLFEESGNKRHLRNNVFIG